ncbi:hypothetical protein C7S17_0737 [Burkholderia thailandensis]|nr:hypothetical protein [Burkholderia thailandensis]
MRAAAHGAPACAAIRQEGMRKRRMEARHPRGPAARRPHARWPSYGEWPPDEARSRAEAKFAPLSRR